MTSAMSNFTKYLKSHICNDKTCYTHTRIGDKELKIAGGMYKINDEKDFINKYYENVFIERNKEYLTEKQLVEDGPILIDIDLRYDMNVKDKQHTEEHVIDAIMLYMEKCNDLLEIKDNSKIDVFVMEKQNVNKLDTKTKDGIHIIIGISMHKGLQMMLREKVLLDLRDIWDLPITNSWEDVLDEGVTKGHVNWQLYGSRKPGNEAYLLKGHYIVEYNESDWEYSKNEKFDTKKYIHKLSARYRDYPKFDVKENIKEEFEKRKHCLQSKNRINSDKNKMKKKLRVREDYGGIKNEEMLDELLEELFDDIGPCNYKLKETHDYTMCLPESYYGPGSFTKWIRVGWALANTNDKLFLTWLKLSSQDNCRDTLKGSNGKFDWSNVEDLYNMWSAFEKGGGANNLSDKSIMYWAKNDAYKKYKEIYNETISYFIEQSITTTTEFDLANVLYQMYKDRFVCVSIKNNCWYEYNEHRWCEVDCGNTLRLMISKDMWQLYVDKMQSGTLQLQTTEPSHESYDAIRKNTSKLAEIAFILKKTTWKNNIMREARELFYDQDFISKIDQNPYLLCFNNCVVDFKDKRHRRGQPDDYISKTTNIDYCPLDYDKHAIVINEINEFIDQLFPDKNLRDYMWQHLSSVLIGTNDNQTFNIYTGTGRNGKSKLVDLMTKALGDYKGTVPITLITQKRNSIGSTSSEIVQLMGVRYAVMQEPSKGETINEGIMKEITGGDPIQGRALFKDTVTFIPQFKLVVCTNSLFDIKSNDDGTWRRIRVCDFVSKFLEKPYEDEDKFPKEHYPHQYKIDKNIDEKFNTWAPILMSMLVDESYKRMGIVKDCDNVMSASDKYREGQDYLAEFLKDNIVRKVGKRIGKTALSERFKIWWSRDYGGARPKLTELYDHMTLRYGACVGKNGWKNVEFIDDEDSDED